MAPDDLLREYLALRDDRRVRDRRRLLVGEGVGHFVAAVDADWPLRAVLHCPKLLASPVAQKLVRQRRRAGVPTAKLSPEQFRTLSSAPRASGVAAILEQPAPRPADLDPAVGRFWLVLESVRSPGNLGTLLRTSAALGGGGLILCGRPGAADPFDPAVVRASMGALLRQRVVRTDVAGLLRWRDRHGLELVGAAAAGGAPFDRHPFRRPALLALGDERTGLSDRLAAACDATVTVPMRPGCDSLNLGVAGGLVMYAAGRGGESLGWPAPPRPRTARR